VPNEAASRRLRATRGSEMALSPDRWGAQVANERGSHSRRLPDLAFRLAGEDRPHIAVMVIDGQSSLRRERAALAGWRSSILAGQYAQVQYPAASATARHLTRLATEIDLTAPQFIASEHVMTDEPLVLPSIIETFNERRVAVVTATVATPDPAPPSPAHAGPPCPTTEEAAETAERAAEHQKLLDEVLGRGQPARRRRWRRGAV
jgi:hypothetical protein